MAKAGHEDDPMRMPEKGRFEYNFNTFILLGGIITGVATTGGTWGYFASQLNSNDRETKEWQLRHEELHRDRLKQTSEEKARTDQRLAQLEMETRKIENLTYRITVAEQAGLSTGEAIKMLSRTINEQQTDIRVIREILDRQFGAPAQPRRQR